MLWAEFADVDLVRNDRHATAGKDGLLVLNVPLGCFHDVLRERSNTQFGRVT